ncbi:hypothetical protein MANES_09G110201v8 [Manihot esculenta]|uniref:Uncharacterized protein n=1 Tax=Manihot esculenta TaxID=3983 RepID=A0ACB7H6C5_MANES|nr:hypothetical protein MANES_09G110201v8 [Manihot esculenta]
MAFEVLYCFFILISISMFIFPTQSTSSNDIAKFPPHVSYIEKVNVSIYYETLCPGSAYIANDLLNALFKEHLHYIVNLRMVPWGNARVVGPHELFLCQDYILQHGPDECYLNTIHACALKAYTDQEANLVASICKAYKGIAKPVVCANIPPKKNPAPPVCYPHDINGALKISPATKAPPG